MPHTHWPARCTASSLSINTSAVGSAMLCGRQIHAMKSPRSLPCLFAALAAFTAGGCVSQPELRPPDSALRDHLGRIGVVTFSNTQRVRLQVPDSKSDLEQETPSFQVVTPRMVAQKIGPVGGGPEAAVAGALCIATPIVVMAIAPFAQKLRRAYGLVVADTAPAVAAARATLDATVAGTRFEEQLRAQVLADLQRKASPVSVTVASGRDGAADQYTALARRGIDTVLEIAIYEPSLEGREGINPGLGLTVDVRVRLIMTQGGQELYYDYLEYRGSKHRFTVWAANDAQPFRDELARCIARLSDEIVTQLFVRDPAAGADRAQLVALGLSRRPPVQLAPPPGPFWFPPLARGAFAQNR